MNEYIIYDVDTFTDFKGEKRLMVGCVISEPCADIKASFNEYYEDFPLLRVVRVGIAVYNPNDNFDLDLGFNYAYEKAKKSNPLLFTAAGSVIDPDIMSLILKKQFSNVANNPEAIIKNYRVNAAKYKAIKDSQEFIDNGNDNTDTIVDMLQEGIDVKGIVDKVTPFLNAAKNDSSLVD